MKLVQIEYLLDRDPIKVDMTQAFEYIQKKQRIKIKKVQKIVIIYYSV